MTRLERHLPRVLHILFGAALVVVLAAALVPMGGPSTGNADKIQHFLAFYALALLGAAVYRHPRSLLWLCLGLSAYGGLIEVLQPLPPFGRDRDLMDWAADNAGVALAILPILLAGWRRRAGAEGQ